MLTDAQATLLTTVAWVVVILAAIQAVGTYCLIRLLVTGRSIFERKEQEPKSRLYGVER